MMKLGFIGVGKIAAAVVEGLCTSDLTDSVIHLSPRGMEKSLRLAERFPNAVRMESNQEVVDSSDVVFISVRPAEAIGILNPLKFKQSHSVVSFLPFLRLSELAEAVSPAARISRAIPLPTVVTHRCPIPVFNPNDTVLQILGRIGQPLPIPDENQFHAVWTLTGFIAPFYSMLAGLSAWAQAKGVDQAMADRYVADMFYSILSSNHKAEKIDFGDLVGHASTPGGMNEQAEKEISDNGAHEAYRSAADNLLRRFG